MGQRSDVERAGLRGILAGTMAAALAVMVAAGGSAGWLASGAPPAGEANPVAATPTSRPKPLDGWVIALDPGHGGTYSSAMARQVPDGRGGRKPCNTGGTSTAKGYSEHAFNFDVARRTAKLLRAKGAEVVMTRTTDSKPGPCVDVRGVFAQSHGADAMISLHGDGSTNTALRGHHAIVASKPLNAAQGAPSRALAKAIIAELEAVGFVRNPNYSQGLSKRSDIAGVNLSERPVVMMELGEMRNSADARLMSLAKGRQRYAQAITRGIVAWAAAHKPGTWDDIGSRR